MYDLEELIVSIISLTFVFIGGCFALWQWYKSLVYKRAEIVQKLIDNVRCNKSVSTIMDMIDWNEDFVYNGKFQVDKNTTRNTLKNFSDDDLFKMIDQTLSTFSYICYLKKVHTITGKDMRFFEYEIRRLVDNPHIANYLYSLYHWSKSLGVEMSFSYVINYCIKKKYLDKSFKLYSLTGKYKCFLAIRNAYARSGNQYFKLPT